MDLYCALSGIEQALWDITGKKLGAPTHMLLGGACRDKIRVYANGWSGGAGTSEELAQKASEVIEMGFTALKFVPLPGPWRTYVSQDVARAAEGQLITLTASLTAPSTDAADNLVLTPSFQGAEFVLGSGALVQADGTWTLATIPAGELREVSFQVQVVEGTLQVSSTLVVAYEIGGVPGEGRPPTVTVEVDPPQAEAGCNCTEAGGSASLAWILTFAALTVLRRRRTGQSGNCRRPTGRAH